MPRSLLNAPHQTLEMRQAGLSTAILLFGSTAVASGNWSTAQGPSEEFVTSEAMRVMPKGATIMDTQCKSIYVGASNRYQCTIPYSPSADK